MSAVLKMKSLYDFEVESDILFFKVGSHNLVSFHGRNYHIKKRMSAEQLRQMVAETGFVPIKSDCYVNVSKITSIEDDFIYFGLKHGDCKTLSVSRRKQHLLLEMMKK
ncbi:LytTR family transcriptional regulator DNA-binding domain-containing protein [Paenibacillus tarimensis]